MEQTMTSPPWYKELGYYDEETIKAFEEACQARGYDLTGVLPAPSIGTPAKHVKAFLAYALLVIIIEHINEGHQFDWNDWSEKKWYPWFDLEVTDANPSGFRFYDAGYDVTDTFTTCGSRLCFKTREACENAAKKFESLYRDMIIVPK